MAKIKMKTPVVELDGDEMTRIWGLSKDRLILPYLDIDLKYYVLGIEYRDKIEDWVTVGASQYHPPERRHHRKGQQHNRCSSHRAGQRVSESADGLAGIPLKHGGSSARTRHGFGSLTS
jgi:hypothetical protein